MIMKRLTPEEAFRAFKEEKQIFTLQPADPHMTVQELIERDDLVLFEETAPQPETSPSSANTETEAETPTGRNKAAEAGSTATVADTDQKPKRGRPRKVTA